MFYHSNSSIHDFGAYMDKEGGEMKKAYIAGKITGNKNYKQEFNEGEAKLIKEGYMVMNPSHMQEGFEQEEYWHVCMAMIDVCEVVYFLPTWTDSKGSHLEMGYAKGTKKEIRFLKEALKEGGE
jgi:nucleoside 2-deoxyribosyltransferase